MNKVTSALHDATHAVTGVPEHGENQPTARHEHAPAQNPERHHQAPARHQNSPRVLIAWQNWIARRVPYRQSVTSVAEADAAFLVDSDE